MKKIIAVVIIVAACAGGYFLLFRGKAASEVPVAKAEKKALTIVLTEEGTLQPYNFVRIKADVTSTETLTVTFVIPNGTSVRKGEKLIEFDPADIDNAISKAKLEVQSAETQVNNAKEERKKSELDRDLNIRDAEFKLEVAKRNLEKYTQIEYTKEVDQLKVAIEKAQVDFEEAQKNLEAANQLFKDGLVPEFEVKKNEIALKEADFIKRKTTSDLELLEKYQHPLKKTELENEVTSNDKLLASRKSLFDATLSQRDSDLANAEFALSEAKTRSEKLKKDKLCLVLTAPVDGIVNYGRPASGFEWRGNEADLKVGEKIGAQSTLMYIPDLSEMFVELQVDEVDISKLLSTDGGKKEEAPEEEPDIDLSTLTQEDVMGAFMKAGQEAQKLFESIDASKIDQTEKDIGKAMGGLSPEDQKKVKKFLAKHLGKKPSTRFKKLPVTIKAESFPDAKITGIIDYVAGAAKSGSWFEETAKFEVKVKLEQSCDWFRPGLKMKADVLIEKTAPVVCVPMDAVFTKDGKKVCYVRQGAGFSAKDVQTGKSDKDFVEIVSGVGAGDMVALKNPDKR
jgi:multidrug efflux pump subunit AcrA (membrane-fusion protein)